MQLRLVDEDTLRQPPVAVDADKAKFFADVLEAEQACRTSSAADSRVDNNRRPGRGTVGDDADDLVSQDQREGRPGVQTIDDMEIGAADANVRGRHQNLANNGFRLGALTYTKRPHALKDQRLHPSSLTR